MIIVQEEELLNNIRMNLPELIIRAKAIMFDMAKEINENNT